MNTTINISLPKKMYNDAKKAVADRSYASISEFVRAAMRSKLYEEDNLTVNGFTPEFENEVLMAEAESEKNDMVWETEDDIKRDFDNIRREVQPRRNVKSKKNRHLQKGS